MKRIILIMFSVLVTGSVFAVSTKKLPVPPAAAANTTPAGGAVALTNEEKATLQKWQKYVNDMHESYAKYPVDMCGKEIPIKLNANLVKPFLKAGNLAQHYCEEIRTKLSTMCRNSDELKNTNKTKITKLISRINCGINEKEDQITFKIAGQALDVMVGAKASNLSEQLLVFLDATPD